MRALRLVAPLLFPLSLLLLSGCSVDGTEGDPQGAPAALRDQTFGAASVTYRVQDGAGNVTNYTNPPGFVGTSVAVSQDGTEVSVATSTTVENGQAVVFQETLELPARLSEFNPPLHWPQHNQALVHSAFGGWDLPATGTVPATGTFFAFGVTDTTIIPTTGTNVSYSGRWTGIHWTVEGGTTFTGLDVSGAFTVVVDYVGRSATVTARNAGGTIVLSGVLNYAPATNTLSGASMVGQTGFTGSAVARFFGPAAEELGGTFRLNQNATPSGTNVIMGSFAAKRP
jgi:hypothetical protein